MHLSMPQYTTILGQSFDFASKIRLAFRTLGMVTAATVASAAAAVQVAAEAATPTPTAPTAVIVL